MQKEYAEREREKKGMLIIQETSVIIVDFREEHRSLFSDNRRILVFFDLVQWQAKQNEVSE